MDNGVLAPAQLLYSAWHTKYVPFGRAVGCTQPMITPVTAYGPEGCCAITLPEDDEGPCVLVVRREVYLQEHCDDIVVVGGGAYIRYQLPPVPEVRKLLDSKPQTSALLTFHVPRHGGALQFIHGRTYDEPQLTMRRFGAEIDEVLEVARQYVVQYHIRRAP